MAPKTGFDLIELPLESWTIVHADQHRRQFVRDLYGDEFSSRMIVMHQDEPLDGVNLHDIDGIRKLVQNIATQAKQIVVSAEVINAAAVPSLWYILKQSQAPSGMAYSGSLVLPLKTQFFTIQLMCLETGITGIRESIVVDKLLEQGVSFKDLADANSYCEEGTALAQYSADAVAYDERFPQHPLSRVRRYIAEILQCLAGQHLVCLLLIGLLFSVLLAGAAPPAVSARPQENILVTQKLNQVEVLIAAAKLDKALAIIQDVLVADRNCPRAYFLMGSCYQDSSLFAGNEGKAKAAYERALELDPNYSFPWRKLAELAGFEGRFSEQLRLVNKALAGKPADKFAYRVRAIAYANLRRPQEALADMRKFAELQPQMKRTDRITMADVEFSAGAYQDCIKSLDILLKTGPDGDLMVRKSKAMVKLGKGDEAIKMLEDYLKPDYDYPDALRQLVTACTERGRWQDALRYSNFLVQNEPTTGAYLQRAAIFDKLGQKAKADQDRKSARDI